MILRIGSWSPKGLARESAAHLSPRRSLTDGASPWSPYGASAHPSQGCPTGPPSSLTGSVRRIARSRAANAPNSRQRVAQTVARRGDLRGSGGGSFPLGERFLPLGGDVSNPSLAWRARSEALAENTARVGVWAAKRPLRARRAFRTAARGTEAEYIASLVI
jgi:hypothetical protein